MTDKRNDILKATLRMVSEHGFHGAPMSKIAEEAGVGAGTIYRYFESKDDLINELFLELKHEISAAMLAGFTPQASTEAVFRQVWRNTFSYCIHHPQEMLFLEQFHNSPFQTPESEAATLAYIAPIVELIQAAVENGEIKNMPFEIMSAYLYDLTVALAKRHISGALAMDDEKLELAVRMCWDAVKAGQ